MDFSGLKKIIKKTTLFPILSLIFIASLFLVPPIIKVFGVIFFALLLFTTEKLPVDITAILIMLILMILGLVTPEQGVSGFSSTATITVLCMFILSGGIAKTGVIQKLGHKIFQFAKKSLTLQMIIIAAIVAPLSGLFNNTAAVAIFLPMVMNLSKISKTPATKLLIPLSFLSMLGGTLTLVGTSTNILANSILMNNNLEPFNMFTFTKIGAIVLLVGTVYLITIGRFLLPKRKAEEVEEKQANNFVTEVEIEQGSQFIGKRINEIDYIDSDDVKVNKITRGEKSYVKNINKVKLKEGDILVLTVDEQKLMDLDDRENEKLLLNFNEERRRIPAKSEKIVKAVVPNLFHNKKIGELNFWKKFQAAVIGINRKKVGTKRLAEMKLRRGEIILIKVSKSNYQRIQNSKDIVLLEEMEQEYDSKKSWVAIGIITLVVLVAALNILPIMVSAIMGVILMFVTGCLDTKEIYETVSWDVIFLLAGLIPLGIAMQESGAANFIAGLIVNLSDYLSPLLIFGVFYIITTILTELISNNAAVVLLVPIALAVAQKLGINPISLTLIVMFASSTSFLSPVGYQTNTMVYSAGNYKFSDFIKVGLFLNIILLFVTSFSIYYFFGA
ncbi:hypothetical protein GF366_02290 [Candidatus Peregrinibacteria bacterium]|nr:hypothetical protein [Candidatus Peregrinibacteria bacterium]